MRILISLIVLFFSATQLSAQDYNVLLIPDSLKKNADLVNRYSEMHYTIINEKKAILYEKEVYTILNEAGNKFADYVTRYDQFSSINNIDGTLYDAFGKKIKEVKKRDISDHASYDGYSLMNDDRYKEHNFYYTDYPYTVEYEEEDEVNQLFHIDGWDPQISPYMSVQYSKLIIETPQGFKFRYKQFNLSANPQITQSKGNTIYTWEVKNLTTKKPESWQPSWREIMPSVMLAPSAFGVGNYSGNMDTWKSYGDFVNVLRKGKDILPDAIKQKVHELTDNLKDPHEKVNVLYNYLQQNSRYVSVQLGVGGWQPFDATYVASNKYGDCKALSNYMIALLKEAGVSANYVLIDAGGNPRPIYNDFAMTQFNHATVCVPLGKDSVWLECTSQTQSPGYAGLFTGNRYALLMNETGGHVVRTPTYTSNDNTTIRRINATIDDKGNLNAEVVTTYTGCESDDLHLDLESKASKEIEEDLKEKFSLPTYDVTAYNYKETKARIPSIDEKLNITSLNYASVTGKRMFLMPDILTRNNVKIDTSEKRVYDIVLKQNFKHIDSVFISLSKGYTVENLPKNVILNNAFGSYSISFTINGNTITCIRYFEQKAARFSVSEYADFGNFLNTIYKADHSQLVLIKKDN